ncbi:unnamed protein product, partial [marine sediment metagenome]
QYNKQYCLVHKDKVKQYYKQYGQDNKEEISQRAKQYRLVHKEGIKQYLLVHKEEIKQNRKRYLSTVSGKFAQKKHKSKHRKMKHIMLITNPFPSDIKVDDHHVLNNFHAIDANSSWNKWFVIPMPAITHNYVGGNASNLEHWRHNEEWIRKLYDIDIKELFGFVGVEQ